MPIPRRSIALMMTWMLMPGALAAVAADEHAKPSMYSYEEMMLQCPEWAREEVPERFRPYRGRHGLPAPYTGRPEPIGAATWGIDFWQANHFIAYRPETAKYLYSDYTPTDVHYVKGTLPTCEAIVAEYTAGVEDDTEKAVILLTKALPPRVRHPFMAPLGPACQTNRALDDEGLLESGIGFCNEQARVFVRLCQVAGIPARIIFLFYADKKNGHVVAEFYTEGRWHMADASWFCVFPGPDGKLMSAAECHKGEGKLWAGKAYHQRFAEICALDDEALAGGRFAYIQDEATRAKLTRERAAEIRKNLGANSAEAIGESLWQFGVMNYPLPR